MDKYGLKMLLRSIRSSLGRYLAILAIVALGVGFFAGLKSSQPAMQSTVDEYMRDNRMFDFQLMSSLGLTESDRAAFAQLDGVKYAEGAYGVDAMAAVGKTEEPYRFMSVTENVSVPLLVAGRMPETDGECLADAGAFSEKDIGKTVQLSEDNDADTLDMFTSRSYKIVGIAKSPRYISNDRGSTSLGSGSLKGFIILPAAAFNSEVYHEILLYCNFDGALFSSEYDTARDKLKPRIQQLLNRCGARRYETLRAETNAKLADAQLEINDGWDEYYANESSALSQINDGLAQIEAAEAEQPLETHYPVDKRKAYRTSLAAAKAAVNDYTLDDAALDATAETLKNALEDLKASKAENLALGKKATASSTHDDDYWGWNLSYLNDGQIRHESRQAGEYVGYSSETTPDVNHVEWVSIDLGEVRSVDNVVIYPPAAWSTESGWATACRRAFGYSFPPTAKIGRPS